MRSSKVERRSSRNRVAINTKWCLEFHTFPASGQKASWKRTSFLLCMIGEGEMALQPLLRKRNNPFG